MAMVYRFVDSELRTKAETNLDVAPLAPAHALDTASYPVVSIDDDARYVLGQTVRAQVFFSFAAVVSTPAMLHLTFPAPDAFHVDERVALSTETTNDGDRMKHPPILAVVKRINGEPQLSMELALPDTYANRRIGVTVYGTVVPSETALFHRTAPVTIPSDAYLDFAIGIEEAAWGQGPVEFRIRTCVGVECVTSFTEVLDPSIPDVQTWQPRRIDLNSFAGQSVSFSFESHLLRERIEGFSLPVWANPTVYAPNPSADPDVNIILVSLDTLSAKHLPTYGYEHPTAPFIDDVLAREGTVFERAVAAATATPQSHMSMFTSMQPCRHGVTTGLQAVRGDLLMLAEVLRGAGYETGAVTEDGWLGYQTGFGRGFNVYAENKSSNVMSPEGQFDLTLAKARAWIVRNKDKPFFLFLHTFQIHDPYTPPSKYADLFRMRDGMLVDETAPRPLQEVVSYDQEIRYTDDMLRSFFEFLKGGNVLERTILIVTSDHGEEFFEHGYWGHGVNLFDEVTRIPLIFWGPGRISAGVRHDQTVGHIDLMPTILALTRVKAPEQVSGRNILADSLEDRSNPRHVRFSEAWATLGVGVDYQAIPAEAPSFMVQQRGRKFSRYQEGDGMRYEAYDVDADPDESENKFASDTAEYDAMKRLIDEYAIVCATEAARSSDDEPSRRIELGAEREEKLRALGYLD